MQRLIGPDIARLMQNLSDATMPCASTPAACLIVEPLPVVAHDIATTLRETFRCATMVAASEAQASALLSELDPNAGLRMAVIRMAPGAFANSALRPMIEARNAAIILMGSDAVARNGTEGWPWALLEWPFGTGQLLAILESLGFEPDQPA